jgi:hypothetical protein
MFSATCSITFSINLGWLAINFSVNFIKLSATFLAFSGTFSATFLAFSGTFSATFWLSGTFSGAFWVTFSVAFGTVMRMIQLSYSDGQGAKPIFTSANFALWQLQSAKTAHLEPALLSFFNLRVQDFCPSLNYLCSEDCKGRAKT